MDIDSNALRDALRKILEIEHAHLYGAKTGSESARRREVEAELNRVLDRFAENIATDSQSE